MNFPFVLDIAIGLIFIYLILSLLASEIQELITTVLQWRAVHLKESIEGLLSSNSVNINQNKNIRLLANQIYNNPLIKEINHESKGLFASIPRYLVRFLGVIFRFGQRGTFGHQNSGPSYISAPTFVSCLFETLQFHNLTYQLTKLRLETFISSELIDRYGQDSLKELDRNRTSIIRDLDGSKFNLSETIDRISELVKINSLTAYAEAFGDSSGNISSRKKELLMKRLQPSLTEVVQLIIIYNDPLVLEKCKEIYAKLQGKATYEDVRKEVMALPDLPEYVEQCLLFYAGLRTNEEIRRTLKKLPPLPEQFQKSLYSLAKRSQTSVKSAEQQLLNFQKEAENWFDRSMDRASGVYKRNAKLVAIVLGCCIAVAANADSLYLVNRLAKEQSLRSAITQAANTVAISSSTVKDIDIERVNAITENLSLPMGWSQPNLTIQRRESEKWFFFNYKIPALVINAIGWLISGIAISMGASFWYDLLGKFINIRNVGKKTPEASSPPDAVIEVENVSKP